MGRTLGGAAVDAFQSVLRGRTPLRFSFEVTPLSIGGLPEDVPAVSLVWETGSSVSFTDPAPVSQPDGTAAFAQVMHHTATVYKQGNSLLAKCCTFKVQAVCPSASQQLSSSRSSRSSKTVARARLDLAQFCAAQTVSASATATEVQVPLQPQGCLALHIKAAWLQDDDRSSSSKSAQLAAQRSRRSFAQSWGSTSDSADTNNDLSSVASSWPGDCLTESDRDTPNTGSAELDRLLKEAEAATAAKSIAPGASGTTNNTVRTVLTLASLSTGPRGPKKPLQGTGSSLGAPACLRQQQPLPVRAFMALLSVPSGSSSSSGGGSRAATITSASSSHNSAEVFADSTPSSLFGSGPGSVAGSRKWHRRASSVPDTPTILEADAEGLPDAGSFTGQPEGSLRPAQPAMLPFGLKPSSCAAAECALSSDDDSEDADSDDDSEAAVWMDACPSTCTSTAALAGGHPEGLRSLSGSMPVWLWPSSRLAVRQLTTDELMRRISSGKDVAALQRVCRGLLCERNDHRFRATRAERANAALQQELLQLRESEAAARLQLQDQAQLLHKLVEAKLQLAQADLCTQDLRGQLKREKKRHAQALTKLANCQHNVEVVA